MSPIVHQPFEVHLGPLNLTGFGLAVFLAYAISQIVCQHELQRRGHVVESGAMPDIVLASVLGMLVGGKLYYVAFITHNWRDILSRAGFVFWGGLIGGVILNWLYIRYKKFSFPRFADVAGIAIAAGYAVGRTGCWAVGDDYGRPWNGPLAVQFPNGSPPSTASIMSQMFGTPIPPGMSPDTVLSVHPTQLYEVAMGLVMFALLYRMRDHKHAEGWLFGVYCVLAGLERFIVEFFRAKDDRLFGILTVAQLIGLAITAVGVVVMVRRNVTGPDKPGIYPSAKRAAA